MDLSNAEHQPMSSDLELSVVVPVFDEIDNLEALDAEIRVVLSDLGQASEIIYVDDASTDGSSELLDRLVSSVEPGSAPTRAIHFRRNFGQTAAMACGFQAARGRVIVPMDADMQNNPQDIPALLERLDEGYDVVSGWRRDRQDRAIERKLPSRVANWLIGKVTGVVLHDYGCGEMHRYVPVYMRQLGARVTEMVVDHRPRVAGVSKYGSKRIFKVFLDLFLVSFMSRYHTRPMHFFGQAALLFFSLFGLSSLSMVIFKFGWLRWIGIDYQASFVETPMPALAATFFLGGIVSVFLGIVGEMLIRVYHEVGHILPYSITRIESSDDAR
jgi:glycosyltransferase involved in cell wall biosynthesis